MRCVLLADTHHAFAEGVRRLLATEFEAVVMVADEVSLFATAGRLNNELAVVDLSLARGDAAELVRRFKASFPEIRMIVLSIYDQDILSRSVLQAGADAFVVKSAIATDLLPAADAVLEGKQYVSSRVV